VALQNLVLADPQVPVRDTTFSTDALGRYICSTWQEWSCPASVDTMAMRQVLVIGAGARSRWV
jgi:hypothetical protein